MGTIQKYLCDNLKSPRGIGRSGVILYGIGRSGVAKLRCNFQGKYITQVWARSEPKPGNHLFLPNEWPSITSFVFMLWTVEHVRISVN